MIVLFLSGMVAMIMMRTLHRDFNRYNATEAAEDVEEETGWKLVHGDVYAAAPPRLAPRRPRTGELRGVDRRVSCWALTRADIHVSRAAASDRLRCQCCSQ